ncbi:MAG: aldehyde dehydrogenase family protein [Cupriavidus necator]
MKHLDSFYLDGQWVKPCSGGSQIDIFNPATELPIGKLPMGTTQDVEHAVQAARAAFPNWSTSSRDDRIALLERISDRYQAHLEEFAQAVNIEIGAPITLCRNLQAPVGLAHLRHAVQALRDFAFEAPCGKGYVLREPIGVAVLITAWNWPLSLIAAKVATALAAGCTVILKPSETAPLSALLFAEIMHEANAPKGVFGMLHGDGKSVGAALASHPGVDMVSITGSTRAGIEVAFSAAPTVKRVAQELGGKSPLLILEDADLRVAVVTGVKQAMQNTGQTCVAPTRMLVPRTHYEEAVNLAAAAANSLTVGDPTDPATEMGPIANRTQYNRVQQLIGIGLEEGARLVAGGLGRPAGLLRGFYAKPTVLADVHNAMTVAREEIFGPVLVMIPYDDEDQAVAIANDTAYGLAAYVASSDSGRAHRVASRLRVGSVRINGASMDIAMPFGGYKASGNGRENGSWGLAEFLEYKSVVS